jgi:hypothetical protein
VGQYATVRKTALAAAGSSALAVPSASATTKLHSDLRISNRVGKSGTDVFAALSKNEERTTTAKAEEPPTRQWIRHP